MSSALIITLEMTGVLGVVLGLGVWELLSLRRDRKRNDVIGREEDPPAG